MMTKKRLARDFLPYVHKLKENYDLSIVETHIHPFDVIGVVHYADYRELNPGEFVYKKFVKQRYKRDKSDFIGWLSKFDYNKYAFSLFNFALQVIPGYESFDLRHAFSRTGESRLLMEMDEALVDEAVLLPVEPWLPTDVVHKAFSILRELFVLDSISYERGLVTGLFENDRQWIERLLVESTYKKKRNEN